MPSEHIVRAQFPCVCGKVLEVTTPSRSVLNSANISVAAFPHEKPVVCPECQRNYAPAIAEIEILWGWQQIEAQKEVVLIDAPNVIKEVSKRKQ